MAKRIVLFADAYLPRVDANAFGTVMGSSPREFNWGSNSNAANQGIALINAYLITKDRKYTDAALTNMDYLLGRNATGYCFVTGTGYKSIMRRIIAPRLLMALKIPFPACWREALIQGCRTMPIMNLRNRKLSTLIQMHRMLPMKLL